MVVTITPVQPGNRVGPGIPLGLSSDFIGPLGTGSGFITHFQNPTGPVDLLQLFLPTAGARQTSALLLSSTRQGLGTFTGQFPQNDQSITVTGELFDGTSTVDTGSRTSISWVANEGLGVQANQLARETSGQGGFTETDRQIITSTQEATVASHLLDSLTLQEMTNGPQGGTVSANLLEAIFGVIVRISALPPDVALDTPDQDYAMPTLAVVSVFRGSDLWMRVPVHTTSRLVSLWSNNILVGLTGLTLTQWMLNMTVQVSFKPGVLGQAFLMNVP